MPSLGIGTLRKMARMRSRSSSSRGGGGAPPASIGGADIPTGHISISSGDSGPGLVASAFSALSSFFGGGRHGD